MEKFVIEGGERLRGSVRVSGSKNAVLPVLAATLPSRRRVQDNVRPGLTRRELHGQAPLFHRGEVRAHGRQRAHCRYNGRAELYGPVRDGEGDAGFRPRPRRPRRKAEARSRLVSRRVRHRRAAHRPPPEGASQLGLRRADTRGLRRRKGGQAPRRQGGLRYRPR